MTNWKATTFPPLQYFFRVEVAILKFMGLSTFNTVFLNDESTSNWRQGALIIIGAITILTSAGTMMHKIVCGENEVLSIIATSLNTVTHFLNALRGFRWVTHQHILHKILHRLSTLWSAAISKNYLTEKHLEAAYRVKRMTGIFSFTIVALCSSYILRPYIILLEYRFHRGLNDSFDYSTFILVDKYAFSIESKLGYFIFIIYEEIVIHIENIFWVSSDPMFAQLLTHISIQFNILAYNLENITKDDNNDDEYVITQRLRKIAIQHNQLFQYCHLIETFYNPIIFLSVLSSAVNTCCCLYAMEAQVTAGNWNEISKSAFYLIVLALQMVIYCDHAETLTQSSLQVFYACTWAEWTGLNKRNKIILYMIMMRAQKEYEYTIYGMIVVNLNRLTMIANGSISYFMLLRNFG